ncbi:YdeI/OmpD-associated family protein [uncultured Cellulomonas sp.]|uniref:YdeI/OmpD-associated family protein n=1 Tax=uncultured Cellulomonas sp. TaxID=189682 RepID=UPI0028E272F3|nr:YdeI/OmpD-associated family protein [uncultured Cellulomonas sp.]
MRFRSTVQLSGKSATGIPVPAEAVAAMDRGARFPVVVTLNGHSYRSTVTPYRGQTMLPLSAENRLAAGVEAGQEVDVDIEPDDAPRTVVVPDDLAAALAGPAREAFDALSFSRQRAIVEPVEAAKTPETRQRRIAKAAEELAAG